MLQIKNKVKKTNLELFYKKKKLYVDREHHSIFLFYALLKPHNLHLWPNAGLAGLEAKIQSPNKCHTKWSAGNKLAEFCCLSL